MIRKLKDTAYLRLYTLLKIPLIAFLRPVIEELDDHRCVIRFPLGRRSRNHLNSMYFGALCVGADCAGGLIAMRTIQQRGDKVAFVFKDFRADFLKRAEGDVLFTCDQGEALRGLVVRAEQSGEREEQAVHVTATVPDRLRDEPVAEFDLTISLKRRSA